MADADALRRLRTRAALTNETLLTADELALVLPDAVCVWVTDQVEPCSIVEGITLYEWGDVRGTLGNPPRPQVVEANKKRRAHKRSSKAKGGHLTVNEAAKELGISDRTLRKRLKDGVPKILGGPIDVSSGRYRHWRFPESTLIEWWRALNAHDEPPAKPKRRTRPKPRPRTMPGRRTVDWSKLARGDFSTEDD